MRSDSHLLHAYVNEGSQAAFAELVERYLPLVFRSALRLVSFDQHRAEDISQVVFTELAHQANSLASHPHLAGWLYTATHHTACRILRDENRRRKREAESSIMHGPDHAESSSEEWNQLSPLLDEALRSLHEKDRDALLLRFFSNRTFSEVGTTLRIREDAARMRVSRALEKLRDILSRRGVVCTPPALATLLAKDTALGAPASLTQGILASAAHIAPATASFAATLAAGMSTTKAATAIAALAALSTIGVAVHQSSKTSTAMDHMRTAQANVQQLRDRLHAATSPQDPAAPQQSASTVPAPPTASAPAEDPYEIEIARGDAFLAANPDVRDKLLRMRHAQLRGHFLPMYRELGLTDEQIEQFELLVMGSSSYIWSVGMLRVGERVSQEERDKRLRALLGENGFRRFWDTRTSPADGVAQRISESLAFASEPITPQQSAQVVQIVRDVINRLPRGADFWPEALPGIDALFSPAQREHFTFVYLDDQYQRATKAARNEGSAAPSGQP